MLHRQREDKRQLEYENISSRPIEVSKIHVCSKNQNFIIFLILGTWKRVPGNRYRRSAAVQDKDEEHDEGSVEVANANSADRDAATPARRGCSGSGGGWRVRHISNVHTKVEHQ